MLQRPPHHSFTWVQNKMGTPRKCTVVEIPGTPCSFALALNDHFGITLGANLLGEELKRNEEEGKSIFKEYAKVYLRHLQASQVVDKFGDCGKYFLVLAKYHHIPMNKR